MYQSHKNTNETGFVDCISFTIGGVAIGKTEVTIVF